MHLYGKDILKQQLDTIASRSRLPHAIMLYGEKGSGRLVMANYIAKLFLCGEPPCEACSTCSRINNEAHPDVIFIKRECGGKYGLGENQSGLTSIRQVMESIVIKPNDGDIKVYIFEDCDEMTPQVQNTLLKIIEEPASFLRFVFICENTDYILETIRSRVTEFEVPLASVEDCARCLTDNGTPPAKAKELSGMLSGNIGKCLDVLEGKGDTPYIETARKAASAIGKRDGYAVAAALSEQAGRTEFAATIGYLTEILRDALVARCGGTLTSCGKTEAQAVAKVHGNEKILDMLDTLFTLTTHSSLNLNMQLTAAYLTTKLI